MASKESFLLYQSMKGPLLSLPDNELRLILSAMFEYNESGNEPLFEGLLNSFWLSIKSQMDRDHQKYLKICERNRSNGSRGGRPARQENPENPVGSRKPDTDTDTDTELPDGNNNKEPSEDKSSSGSSPKRSKAKKPSITFGYETDARIHGITREQLTLWKENFPAIDVEGELKKASAWLDANRKNRKKDVKKFLSNWLSRSQDRARPVPGQASVQPSLDDEWSRATRMND